MRRRQILGGAAIGAGLLGCPGWVARAFAQAASPAELAALSDAYRRAQRTGRPLLILVIPSEPERVWDHQYAFGELLNHATPETMADLALAELACAGMATVRTLVPQAGAEAGEPWMLVVEPDVVPARVVRFDGPVPEHPERWVVRDGEQLSWEEQERLEDQVIGQRIAALSAFVHRAIAPDAATLARRAALARAHVPASDRQRVEQAIAGGGLDPHVAALAPAVVAEAALARGGAGDPLRATLADVAVQRWRNSRVPGSRWATGGGCGISIEGEPDDTSMMVACGMGHVAARSARFLYWYSGGE